MRAFLVGRLVGMCLLGLAGCGDDGVSTAPVAFGAMGPLAGDAGKGSFRFGAASAATQIEDMNTRTDWWVWTAPTTMGGLGKGTFVGDAVKGYSKAIDDVQLVKDLGLDSYRFSIEWARIEPQRNVIDEAAIQHYRDQLMALKAAGIRPLVTLHHFSNPVWVVDPRDLDCASGPTDTNLCGFGHPVGGPLIVDEMEQHAALIGQRFGDLVDEWGTVNEPINYLIASYGLGIFPPGRNTIFSLVNDFVPVLRDYINGHVKMYKALKANDTIDADGDGVAAVVGFSLSVADWQASRDHKLSTNPDDIAARDRLVYLFHYAMMDALTTGMFDANLDGTGEEAHPDWVGTADWLGIQYYFRTGVSGDKPLIPAPVNHALHQRLRLRLLPADPGPDVLRAADGLRVRVDGLRTIRSTSRSAIPRCCSSSPRPASRPTSVRDAPRTSCACSRRSRARDESGVDVRGFYYWSLTNFEGRRVCAPLRALSRRLQHVRAYADRRSRCLMRSRTRVR